MTSETDTKVIYEIFRDDRPKYQIIWTNSTKRFYISGKEVSEDIWITAVQRDKT